MTSLYIYSVVYSEFWFHFLIELHLSTKPHRFLCVYFLSFVFSLARLYIYFFINIFSYYSCVIYIYICWAALILKRKQKDRSTLSIWLLYFPYFSIVHFCFISFATSHQLCVLPFVLRPCVRYVLYAIAHIGSIYSVIISIQFVDIE